MRFTPSTIFVLFNDWVSELTISKLLNSHKIDGTLVSPTMNRWAIEVPFEKEKTFIDFFRGHELVRSVSDSVISGYQSKPRPQRKKAS